MKSCRLIRWAPGKAGRPEFMRNGGSKKTKVGLVQINNSFSNQNYLPYSVGLLESYFLRYTRSPGRYEFLLPIYCRLAVEKAVEKLLGAEIVGFSAYVWNIRISLEIAKALKREKPETLIVFGGPHVPDRSEEFLRKNPFIDLCVHGEGERVFMEVLENFPARDWENISSLSYLREDGSFVLKPKGTRVNDLALIPSPYLDGAFDSLMDAYPEEQWLILWETNRGCPFSCTFCDWGSAVQSKVYPFELDRLFKEVEWFANRRIEFIFCCDANFGILPRDLEIAQYVAEVKQRRGFPRALSVQNTKNATERAYKVQKLLADSGLNKGVTISFQSVDPETLKSIKRSNISTGSFQELQRRFTRDNVETYTDLILGLPGETYDSFAEGVSQVIENGQHNRIQFNNLSILPNAEMGDPEYQKKYGMVTVETKVVNIHGSLLESKDEIYETQQLVTATNTMPREDWRRTRAFSWTAGLLHFDKVLQIPLVLLHEICGVKYRDLIELFSREDSAAHPVLSEIRDFFLAKARDIQEGGAEYVRSEEWLNIWWPADEYIVIKLCTENKLVSFYEEATDLLNGFLENESLQLPSQLLSEAVLLNRLLFKLPFQTEDLDLELSHNLWEFYQGAIRGTKIPLEEKPCHYHIDRTREKWSSWEDWYREVIWYGNKKGAYLYGNSSLGSEMAGHF